MTPSMVTSQTVVVIGAGGREHALVNALLRSPSKPTVEAIPGNEGMPAEVQRHPIALSDHEAIRKACVQASVVVIGPEQPLVDGLADQLRLAGIPVVGPSKVAAQLEGSKSFAKQVMDNVGVPTARWARCTDAQSAKDFADQFARGVAIKVDGLAAGKGVSVVHNPTEAHATIDGLFRNVKGGPVVVVEERLEGPELSLLALCDGESLRVFPPAQDHKRLLDGDQGPNTGGMGAYAPAPLGTPEVVASIVERCMRPVVEHLAEQHSPLVGVLYAGVIITEQGPKVLEYNVRFGDPEAQAVLPLVQEDLFRTFLQVAKGVLEPGMVALHEGAAMTVVLASEGYPQDPQTGKVIQGLEVVFMHKDVEVYHAGTERKGKDAPFITAGGRVLGVTARGDSLLAAAEKAYAGVRCISFDGMQYRRDIAYQALGGAVG
ncbi:MAG: phosphoribosylamine--glycine ligase [Myxococcales bacterium]|nr:phosphoribosylamine--glycine ligase [Myxococcales bacterium]